MSSRLFKKALPGPGSGTVRAVVELGERVRPKCAASVEAPALPQAIRQANACGAEDSAGRSDNTFIVQVSFLHRD